MLDSRYWMKKGARLMRLVYPASSIQYRASRSPSGAKLPLRRHHRADRLADVVQGRGFLQHEINVGRECLLVAREAGEQDHRFAGAEALDGAGELVAGHLRHVAVGDHDVERGVAEFLQRLAAIL